MAFSKSAIMKDNPRLRYHVSVASAITVFHPSPSEEILILLLIQKTLRAPIIYSEN
jgi:hypothetical protein